MFKIEKGKEVAICKKCGGKMVIDEENALLTNPPKYKVTCQRCGNYFFV